MAATTIYGIDYPVNTDLVTNGAAQMQLLAGDVETALQTQVTNLWGRNIAHNPTMRLNYRNSQPGVGPKTWIADRWVRENTAGATVAYTRNTYTTPQTGLPEWVANDISANTTVSGGVSDYTKFQQVIEDVRTLAGKNVKVSFYAKAASGTPKVGVNWEQWFGSGGTPSGGVIGNGTSTTISTTWTRYTITLSVASIAGKTFGTNNDSYAILNIWLNAGTNNASTSGSVGNQVANISITGVQIEADYVTPLEYRPDAVEELICARYFFATYQQGVYLSAGGVATPDGIAIYSGCSDGSGFVNVTYPYPVTMCKVPTVSFFSHTAGTANVWDYTRSGASGTVAMTVLGAGDGRKSLGTRNSASVGATWIVVQLSGHFVADTGF